MKHTYTFACAALALISPALIGCGGGASETPIGPGNAPVVVNIASSIESASGSYTDSTGVPIVVSPSDNGQQGNGTTPFSRTYPAGTKVTLTAPLKSGGNAFSRWLNCTATTTVTCTLQLNNGLSLPGQPTAVYAVSPVSSVTVTPNPATAVIGSTVQFSAAVAGSGITDNSVTWTVASPQGSAQSPGTITAAGIFTTPYPAPPTVTVTATSNQDHTTTGSVLVTLSQPAPATGPALNVDAANPTHIISPLIYGMNNYLLDPEVAKATHLTLDRWGGDGTTSYSYLVDTQNSAGDYYFENFPGTATNYPIGSEFNTQVTSDAANGTKTLGSVPLVGWTPLRNTACSYSVAKYGPQKATDPYRPDCGNGVLLNGNQIANDPTDTYSPIDETFTAGWIQFLVGQFGTAAKGGVAIYDLDNEPEFWDNVHIDIHPKPMNYDELTNKALTYAKAIKTNDPTAEVSGPVISFWPDFFYSKQDIETGWSSGPCYCYNGNPTDRIAHGNVPLIEYYLQQFKKSEDATGTRLLDYLDLHTYFAPDNLAFSPAGDTTAQQARLNSTRVFWDPTYTDPNYTDPNNRTAAAPPYPPQLIPLMHSWVAADYPGTKTAITEYNWGGQEHINGAIAQADILGIFGREGLDLGTLWGPPDPVKQIPGEMAFELFRNYDGAGSQFGEQALTATSNDQGKLAIYAAQRASDGMVTVMVLNKTYGDLTSSVSLVNLTPTGSARSYLYSNANLAAILPQPDATLTPPATGGTGSTLNATFPAQSITLFVIPTQ